MWVYIIFVHKNSPGRPKKNLINIFTLVHILHLGEVCLHLSPKGIIAFLLLDITKPIIYLEVEIKNKSFSSLKNISYQHL